MVSVVNGINLLRRAKRGLYLSYYGVIKLSSLTSALGIVVSRLTLARRKIIARRHIKRLRNDIAAYVNDVAKTGVSIK